MFRFISWSIGCSFFLFFNSYCGRKNKSSFCPAGIWKSNDKSNSLKWRYFPLASSAHCSLLQFYSFRAAMKGCGLGCIYWQLRENSQRMSEFSHINHRVKQKRKKQMPHTHNVPCSDVQSPFGLCPNSSVHQTLPYPPLWCSTLVRLQPCFFKIKPRSNP